MNSPATLSIVVPCFNEADVLGETYRRLKDLEASIAGGMQLVFVDDGSSDATWPMLRKLAEGDDGVVAIRLSRNFGHQYALCAGLDHSTGMYVAVMDADLQDPPELIPKMLDLARQGYDVVYGRRTRRDGESAFKRSTASLYYRVLNALSDTDIPRDTGDFRVMSRRIVDLLRALPERDRFVRGLVSWLGFRQTALDYDRAPRAAGKSKYPFSKMLRFAASGISSFSVAPLRVCIYLSYVLFALALLGIVYVLWSWAALDAVRGWASLAILVLVLSGCNLFFTGVLGEYVGKTYFQTKMRPLYIVDEVLGEAVRAEAEAHPRVAPPPRYGAARPDRH